MLNPTYAPATLRRRLRRELRSRRIPLRLLFASEIQVVRPRLSHRPRERSKSSRKPLAYLAMCRRSLNCEPLPGVALPLGSARPPKTWMVLVRLAPMLFARWRRLQPPSPQQHRPQWTIATLFPQPVFDSYQFSLPSGAVLQERVRAGSALPA